MLRLVHSFASAIWARARRIFAHVFVQPCSIQRFTVFRKNPIQNDGLLTLNICRALRPDYVESVRCKPVAVHRFQSPRFLRHTQYTLRRVKNEGLIADHVTTGVSDSRQPRPTTILVCIHSFINGSRPSFSFYPLV
jgi:hypothetical protein